MENQKSTFSASLIYGLLLAISLIIFDLILFVLDVDIHSKIKWISYLIMIGGIFWAMISYRDKYAGGFISYGQAFGVGFFTVLIAAIITAVYTYFYVVVINPSIIENILTEAEENILAGNPNISDEDLETALHYTEMFTSPIMMAIWGFIANVIFGTILSLIIAIFAKREKPLDITVDEAKEE
jgi:hypothetical protein